MTDRSRYNITRHAMDRYVLRTNKKFKHAHNCKFSACRKCDILHRKAKSEVQKNKEKINEIMLKRLSEAVEDKSCINNTEFMMRYYEKHGFESRFEFLIHEDILFVVVEDEKGKFVVTCIVSKSHIAGRSHLSKNKFKKSPQRESNPHSMITNQL